MQIEEIKAKMQIYKLKQVHICKDLGFEKGDLSSILNEKRPLPESRAIAFDWYFRCKELESEIELLKAQAASSKL